jgi:hypothetical protein
MEESRGALSQDAPEPWTPGVRLGVQCLLSYPVAKDETVQAIWAATHDRRLCAGDAGMAERQTDR